MEKSLRPRSKDVEWGAQDVRNVQQAAEEAQRRKANHLAVFAGAKETFLEKFFWTLAPESDLGIPNSFVRGCRPHLFPLALLADRLEDFLLLVADGRVGELFQVEAGRIAERWEKRGLPPSETRREKGGAYDRRVGFARTTFSGRVEGHLKTHQEKFFKELAEEAAARGQAGGIRSLILGADTVAGSPIKERILRQNSGLDIVLASIDAKPSPARKLSLGIQAFRQREQEISQQRAAELLSPGRWQVFWGGRSVIDFLQEEKRGTVLVLDEAFRQTAPVCGKCSELVPEEGVCPLCAGPVRKASVENELVCLAASAGVEIEFVKGSPELARKGGVGLLV
ncbi:MAG: hypothetical protein L0Z48_02635 [candidate division Zixibacteria bacterium]|nr:hypothetical protein [candidate division Zixibacteria bacterium]